MGINTKRCLQEDLEVYVLYVGFEMSMNTKKYLKGVLASVVEERVCC
jgi:hypothetical protein